MKDTNEFLLLRIEALEKKLLELENEIHKYAISMIVNDPIFEQPIKIKNE